MADFDRKARGKASLTKIGAPKLAAKQRAGTRVDDDDDDVDIVALKSPEDRIINELTTSMNNNDTFFLSKDLLAEIAKVFKAYAKDKDYFDCNDFKDTNKTIEARKMALFQKIATEMDENGDGQIQIEEFFQYFIKWGMEKECSKEMTSAFTSFEGGDKCLGYFYVIQQMFQTNVRDLLKQFNDFSKSVIMGK